jgi:hypothetical protein
MIIAAKSPGQGQIKLTAIGITSSNIYKGNFGLAKKRAFQNLRIG